MVTHPTSAMTTDILPVPYILTGAYESVSDPFYKGFDNSAANINAFYTYNVGNITTDAYIVFDIGAANAGALYSYYMDLPNGLNQIDSWQLHASPDSVSWTLQDNKLHVSCPYVNTIIIGGAISYRYFKWQYFHTNNGDTFGYNAFMQRANITIGSSSRKKIIALS